MFVRFFFLSFSSFPPFETAGMNPLSDTCLRVTGSAGLTCFFFFLNFFHSRRLKWRDWIFDFFFRFLFFGQHIHTRTIINYRLFILGQFLLVWPVCWHNLHCLSVGVLSTTSSSISVLMWVLLGRPFFSLRMFGLWQRMGPSYGDQ